MQVSSGSNFHPDTRGSRWSLIWAHLFSCAVGREEHCTQISLACVGNSCSVWTTLGLPPLRVCVLSQSTLLRLQVALQRNCLRRALGCVHFYIYTAHFQVLGYSTKAQTSAGPEFCALPRSKQLRQPGAWQAHCPRWAVFCSPPWSQTLGFLGVLQEHRLRCAVCLLWGADLWL